MNSCFRSLCVISAVLSLAGCDKPTPPAAAAPVTTETDNQLAEARDALQRQALEIETKTALMDKQLAEMEQSLKDRDNAELRDSLDALKRQNEALRVQADAAREQSNTITQRITVTPPPNVALQPMVLPDYSLFYQQLAPFGRWFEVNGYGFCWQPTITVAGWRPYVDGCWVWTSLGWAWQSNEPFGWATYHYGRWVNLASYGWVWVPGSEWAPAWVAWRQSRDCVGWAPLPPEQGVCSGVYRDCDSRYGLGPASYTFINTNQFVNRSYINVYAPVMRQTTIYQQSVNVTQIVPGHGREHAFVHQGGPPRAQMEQACGQSVPQPQVQTMHADQLPEQQYHHAGRDALAPVAMVELPAVTPGARGMLPEVKEHIQRPVPMSGFEGVPQQAVTEIRETIANEKETAAVQRQPVHGQMPHQAVRQPVKVPAVVNGAPSVPNAPPHETVRPVSPAEKPVLAGASVTPATTVAVQPQPGHQGMPHESPRHSVEAPAVISVTPMTNAPPQETVRPVVAAEPRTGVAREHRQHAEPVVGAPAPARLPLENKSVESPPAVVTAPPAVMPQLPAEPGAAAASAEAERARMQAAREQAHGAAMEQRQQQAMQERAMAEKRAAEQAAASAEAEKSRMQAAAAQQAVQAVQAAQQQRMAADQAAAETERARQQATTAAAQQQQEMAAQQQRAAAAERMAIEKVATAEADRVRQLTEAAAMQRQQEEATRRATEEQQMRAQQETVRRTQEMAVQRQAEEQTRRQQEAEAQRAQEQARRAAEEQQMRAQQEAAQRAQEIAQRQAEEQVRRQQEAEMQRAQEQARRAAEEQQMRAQQEAAHRAQEMAQRQAEEQARRAQEEAHRAAAEASRNQPRPAHGS